MYTPDIHLSKSRKEKKGFGLFHVGRLGKVLVFAAFEQCGRWKKVTEELDKHHHAACCVSQHWWNLMSWKSRVLLSLLTCTCHYSRWCVCVYLSVSCIHWCEWCINKCTVKGKDLLHTESDFFFNAPYERQFELFEHYNIENSFIGLDHCKHYWAIPCHETFSCLGHESI